MAEIMPKLTRLERRKSDLLLTYESGDELSVEYVDLRHACPCAKCAPNRNEDQDSIDLRESLEKLANKKPKVVTVGNYALSFEWEDQGCSSGIYRFERIWALANKKDPDNGKPYVHGPW